MIEWSIMLTEDNICFSDEDEQALIDSTEVGKQYSIPAVYVSIFNENGDIEWLRKINTYPWFVQLISKAVVIEGVNDDCSIVRFVDSDDNELDQLTTTSEFGSVLSSNPRILFGDTTFTKK
jgi:hypothetical protein